MFTSWHHCTAFWPAFQWSKIHFSEKNVTGGNEVKEKHFQFIFN